MFHTAVVQSLASLVVDVQAIRLRVASSESSASMGCLPDVPDSLSKLQRDLVKVQRGASRFKRRLRMQTQRVVAKLLGKRSLATSASKPKSPKRVAAGRLKAVSLVKWTKDLRDAREALRNEGYEGSLKLAKGTPLYEKADAMKRRQSVANVAASISGTTRMSECTSSQNKKKLLGSGGRSSSLASAERATANALKGPSSERLAIHVDAIREAPASLRRQAKRGDAHISVRH